MRARGRYLAPAPRSRPAVPSTSPLLARAVLGAALAVLLGLGASLLLARFRRDQLMRWPAAVVIVLAIAAAVAVGVAAGG